MNKAVFLDRDGTINIDKHYLYKREDFEYLDGAVNALRRLTEAGYLLVVITNQSGIARGYYTEQDFLSLNDWMITDLANKGVEICKTYYCPHYPESNEGRYSQVCECRKPATGLFWRAKEELDIDMEQSYAVGDKLRDLSICNESGVRGFLINNAGDNKENNDSEAWYRRCANLDEAVDMILKDNQNIPV